MHNEVNTLIKRTIIGDEDENIGFARKGAILSKRVVPFT